MRQFFFMGILICGVLASIVYFCWSIIVALYHDWMMSRGVDDIRAQSAAQRVRRQEEAAQRLDNDCEHVFEGTFGGFPPNACYKCGLERQRPQGACDHVWRITSEPTPCSYCEKCGKRYTRPSF